MARAVGLVATLTAGKERQEHRFDEGREVVAALGERPASREVGWDTRWHFLDAFREIHEHLDGTRDRDVTLAEVSSKYVADQLDVLPRSSNDNWGGRPRSLRGRKSEGRKSELGGHELSAFLDAIGGRNTLGSKHIDGKRLRLMLRPDWVGRGSTLDRAAETYPGERDDVSN